MQQSLSVISKQTLLLVVATIQFFFISAAYSAESKGRDALLSKIAVEQGVFDFGTVDEGTVVSHLFEIKNEGEAPLIITSINSACGCTSSAIDGNEVAPGNKAKIEVTFDTKGFFGEKEKSVRVNSNDPETPSLVLTLRGVVTRGIVASPARVFFAKLKRGEERKQEVRIESVESGLKIKEISSSSDNIKIERSSKGNSFTVMLSGDLPLGVFREDIQVKTSSKRRPIITIPVFARVSGEIELFPSDVSFGLVEQPFEQDITKEVILKNTGNTSLDNIELKSDDSSISAVLLDGGASDEKIIKVTLKSGAHGVIKSNIEIIADTQNSEPTVVLLPVYAIVAKDG